MAQCSVGRLLDITKVSVRSLVRTGYNRATVVITNKKNKLRIIQ